MAKQLDVERELAKLRNQGKNTSDFDPKTQKGRARIFNEANLGNGRKGSESFKEHHTKHCEKNEQGAQKFFTLKRSRRRY